MKRILFFLAITLLYSCTSSGLKEAKVISKQEYDKIIASAVNSKNKCGKCFDVFDFCMTEEQVDCLLDTDSKYVPNSGTYLTGIGRIANLKYNQGKVCVLVEFNYVDNKLCSADISMQPADTSNFISYLADTRNLADFDHYFVDDMEVFVKNEIVILKTKIRRQTIDPTDIVDEDGIFLEDTGMYGFSIINAPLEQLLMSKRNANGK